MSEVEKDHSIPVAVISDGKPGHENQSLGIAEHIPDANILVLRHSLKESIPEAWLRFQVRFSSRSRANPKRLLLRVFTKDGLEKLTDHSPVAVIAAGTLSAGPCVLAGALTGAKTCICMKPSMFPLSMFDLAVVPAHDNPPDAPNTIKTLAAPNRVSPLMLSTEWTKWREELPGDTDVISWVIGGPSSSADFDEQHILSALISSLEWASKSNRRVWLSTARRTPVSLEDRIAALPERYQSLSWMLLWHRDQRNPLYAMFHRSRIAIVTSDSVSMIAEAASAGKGPIVCQAGPKHQPKKTKQDRMVDRLIEAGYGTRSTSEQELVGTLDHLLSTNTEFPRLDDTEKAANRLLDLIRIESI